MDELDRRLIGELRRNGRASVPKLADLLGVARGTVQNRLDRLTSSGVIAGFTVRLRDPDAETRVQGIMMIELTGRHKKPVIAALKQIPGLSGIHLTNGIWDLIGEIDVANLGEFNTVVTEVGEHDGVGRTESYIFLGPA